MPSMHIKDLNLGAGNLFVPTSAGLDAPGTVECRKSHRAILNQSLQPKHSAGQMSQATNALDDATST